MVTQVEQNPNKVLMPDTAPDGVTDQEEQSANNVVSALVQHITDDIEDRKTLRSWRSGVAVALTVVAAIFYVVFFVLLYKVINDLETYKPILEARFVSVAVIAALVIVPTLLLLIVAKAVFGMNKAASEMPSPLQAILHLMKEIKGS